MFWRKQIFPSQFPPCVQSFAPHSVFHFYLDFWQLWPSLTDNKLHLRPPPAEPRTLNHKKTEVNKGQRGLISQMEWLWLIRDSIFWAGRGKWKQGEIESGLDYRPMSAAPKPYSNLLWRIGCNQEWQLNWCYLGYFYWGGIEAGERRGKRVW